MVSVNLLKMMMNVLISDKGTMIRTNVNQVPTLSRNTQGVKIISPKDGEKLIECVNILKKKLKNNNEKMEFLCWPSCNK